MSGKLVLISPSPNEISLPLSPASRSSISYDTPPTSRPPVDIDVVPEDPLSDDVALALDLVPYKDDENEQLLPPPDFSTYEPEYFASGDGNIVSHDKHLNEDGEALYRFLLSQASERPELFLHCRSSHTEWRTRQITRFEDGKNVTSTETYSESITDFDFTIDVSDAILPEPTGAPIWIVGDKDAAHRGRRRLEVDSPPRMVVHGGRDANETEVDLEAARSACRGRSWRRGATKAEREASASWKKRREDYGYAPWVLVRGQIRGMEASVESPEDRERLVHSAHASPEQYDWYNDSSISMPSKTLRAWADEYCASRRILKEFTFQKVVYGWNFTALKQAIETTIRNNYVYQDQPHITFTLTPSTISVRPDNRLSRMLSNKWILVLLWITLIYPLIVWPYKRFGSRGGGEWRVAGSAFAMSKWEHAEDSHPGETADDYKQRTPSTSKEGAAGRKPLLKTTPKGVAQLSGLREGEWFSKWERTIGSLVRQRYIAEEPIKRPLGTDTTAGIGLDGYYVDTHGRTMDS